EEWCRGCLRQRAAQERSALLQRDRVRDHLPYFIERRARYAEQEHPDGVRHLRDFCECVAGEDRQGGVHRSGDRVLEGEDAVCGGPAREHFAHVTERRARHALDRATEVCERGLLAERPGRTLERDADPPARGGACPVRGPWS